MTTHRRLLIGLVATAMLATGCGSGSGDEIDATPTSSGRRAGIAAQVASYELVAAQPQRFIIGLLKDDQSAVVAFGKVKLAFAFLGTQLQQSQEATVLFEREADFRAVAGQSLDATIPGPRFGSGSEGTGVYGIDDVTFDKPGFWGVHVTAIIGGQRQQTQASFQVVPTSEIPAPGDAAPKTDNLIASSPGAKPRSIDSRASANTPVPDPKLHDTTIAAAIAARRPLVVVVSTPTYCMSRFCGPITDSVDKLAAQYGDRVAFVHLEVWEDYEAKKLNPAAAEWINPDGGDAKEPWTFVVGSDGVITNRFDNVASDKELEAAVLALVG